jgi:hypothetical protein
MRNVRGSAWSTVNDNGEIRDREERRVPRRSAPSHGDPAPPAARRSMGPAGSRGSGGCTWGLLPPRLSPSGASSDSIHIHAPTTPETDSGISWQLLPLRPAERPNVTAAASMVSASISTAYASVFMVYVYILSSSKLTNDTSNQRLHHLPARLDDLTGLGCPVPVPTTTLARTSAINTRESMRILTGLPPLPLAGEGGDEGSTSGAPTAPA